MADTLTFKKELTGHLAVDFKVVTDGTDIFWESGTFQGDIYKYTVSTDTVSKIVDASSFGFEGGASFGNNITLMVFRGNIYVGIWLDVFGGGWSAGDRVAKVYKVTPSGTVTTVIDDFPRSASQVTGDFNGYNFSLYSTEDYIVAVSFENPTGADPSEFISQWSIDGSVWGFTTDSFSETVEIATPPGGGTAITGRDFRRLGIYASFPVTGGGGGNSIITKFVNGVWSKVVGPSPTSGLNIFEVGNSHFWMDDDLSEYTDDFITFHEPDSQNPACVGLNMPFATGDSVDDDADFVKLNTASPPIGLTVDSTMATDGIAIGVHTEVQIRLNDGTGWLVVKAFGATFPDWSIWERDTNLGATPNAWGGAGASTLPPDSNRPCDIDADGTFLYIGAIDLVTTAPVLLKQETGLTQNATRAFDPADGTDIGVQCGRFDVDVVWAAGNFGGTDTVVKTEDAGDTFTVKDPATFSSVTGFTVGPDSDDRVLLVDKNATIQETEDSGENWTEINAATGAPTTRAIGRLDINVEESVFGSDAGNIAYSPNSGENLEDISAGFAETAIYTGKNVTSIVVN